MGAETIPFRAERPAAQQPQTPTAGPFEPLLVVTDAAAALCGISPASWYRLKAAGKTPAPVKLAGRTLYRVADLQLWVALGCPDRKTFEARRAAAHGR
jgi:predicted DNA-binding transcriptional regulator AlpA